MQVRNLTRAAFMSCIAMVFLLLAGVIPSGALAAVAIASFASVVIVLECGMRWAVLSYVTVSLLSFILLPDKSCAVWYSLVLGHYPMVKCLIEGRKRIWQEWLLKILVFAVSISLLLIVYFAAFTAFLPDGRLWVLLLGLTVVFVMYDIGLSRLIGFYLKRRSRYN